MVGIFYIGQPIPEYNPKRLKVGFTSRPITERVNEHRCTSPQFNVIKTYTCRKDWEYPLIEKLSRIGGFKFLNKEVLECEDPEKVIKFCDLFFEKLKFVV